MKFEYWKVRDNNASVRAELEAEGYGALCSGVLAARGVKSAKEAGEVLAAGKDMLIDPFLLRGMDLAAERLARAIEKGERVAIYGDYDVDGITSVCLLSLYLESRGINARRYIPHREEEGYGLNLSALKLLKDEGIELIVTVDTGVTAVTETLQAAEMGIDIVITDHHECKSELPAAVAVVNPYRPDCPYPYKCLAGVGVVFKLVAATEALLTGGAENALRAQAALLDSYADLLAIGTVADIMPVTGENRAIIRAGLDSIARSPRVGIKELISTAGCSNREINTGFLGYTIAPRLNAAGRMCSVLTAVELLLAKDVERAAGLAQKLCDLNQMRRDTEAEVVKQAIAMVEEMPEIPPAIVLAGENWHQGIVGIVASRLSEKYCRPALIISLDGEEGKGSARSVKGINLFTGLSECADLLTAFGGHDLAAGFTISRENIPEFTRRFSAYAEKLSACCVKPVLHIDVEASPCELTESEINALNVLEPYGPGNPQPVFMLTDATVTEIRGIGAGKHCKLTLMKHGASLEAVFFGVEPKNLEVRAGDVCDAAFFPGVNEFRGERLVQLVLCDMRPCREKEEVLERERHLFNSFAAGKNCDKQRDYLAPTRDEFVALWKYMTAFCKSGGLSLPIFSVARGGSADREPSIARTLVCLEVLSEFDLIDYRFDGKNVSIVQKNNGKKVDLFESSFLQPLLSN